jgi:hypothetical protein
MNPRRARTRRNFALESLELRSAPSHFGVMAHAVVALHHAHAAAHVRHLSDSEVNHKKEQSETNSSSDTSQDHSTDSSHSGSTSTDPSSPDPNSTDPRTDR